MLLIVGAERRVVVVITSVKNENVPAQCRSDLGAVSERNGLEGAGVAQGGKDRACWVRALRGKTKLEIVMAALAGFAGQTTFGRGGNVDARQRFYWQRI